MTRSLTPSPTNDAVLEALLKEATSRLGLQASRSTVLTLTSAVDELCASLGVEHPSDVLARLIAGDRIAIDALATALTIGETYFFRDPKQFDALRAVALAAHQQRGGVRVWSAGCATGEEPYSIAMVLREELGERLGLTEVLGTDVNPVALSRAKEGLYGAWSFRGVPDWVRDRHLVRQGKHFSVRPEVRACVRFAHLNLVVPGGEELPKDVDIVFCRNVVIYFDAGTTERVYRLIASSMRLGGTMFTGASDPLPPRDLFETQVSAAGLIHQRRDLSPKAQEAPSIPMQPTRLSPSRRKPTPRNIRPAAAPRPISPPAEERSAIRAIEHPDPERLLRAKALADRGEHRAAKEVLEPLIRAANHPEAFIVRALIHASLADWNAMQADAERATLLDRELAFPHVLSALALHEQQDWVGTKRAIRNSRRRLASLPEHREVRYANGSTARELLQLLERLSPTRESRGHSS